MILSFTPKQSLVATSRPTSAFTMMELLVTLATVLVLAAIAFPVYATMQRRAHKQVALEKMRTIGGALATYISQNAGVLPAEDADGEDTWQNIKKPEARSAWYNALPRLLGRKAAEEYSSTPADFYKDENLLFLPGANYPDKKKVLKPLFAYAFNTKLQRTNPAGEKTRTQLDHITQPARTVAFLEQGLLNESRTLAVQSKKDYDGSPKGSAKSFVGRYGGQGVLYFFDGHAELFDAADLLTVAGQFPFPQTAVVWTCTPEENPNREFVAASTDRKK